jgi:ADP-heptose:LPS heptosyltransferase
MKHFLIIQTAFIGDVILATPVIEALHTEYPEASIDFLLRKGNEGLLKGHPYLNELLVWDKKGSKYINMMRMIRKIRSGKYDTVINLHRFLNTGLITILSGARHTVGFSKNPLSFLFSRRLPHIIDTYQGKLHETDRNLMLVRHLVKEPKRLMPRLYPSDADFEKTREQQPYITISPTSVWFTKQYPFDKWIELLNMTDPGIKIILLGGKDDVKACEYIRSKTTHENTFVSAGRLSFLESAALMKSALMNYSNDSAPLHLASAMNAPVTAVFCSTIPAFGFGPLSDVSHIIETNEKLDCRPCGIHGFRKCPKGHFKCADIDPIMLLKTISSSE